MNKSMYSRNKEETEVLNYAWTIAEEKSKRKYIIDYTITILIKAIKLLEKEHLKHTNEEDRKKFVCKVIDIFKKHFT